MEDLLNVLAKYNCQVEQKNGKIIITPKNQFKRGDILISLHDGMLCIFDSYYDDWTFTSLYDNSRFADAKWCTNWFRLATKEEKQKLFDELAKQGKQWDTEKCELEDLKWKPKFKETYWYPNFNKFQSCIYPFETMWFNSLDDFASLNNWYIFKTKNECQKKCDELNDAIKNVK